MPIRQVVVHSPYAVLIEIGRQSLLQDLEASWYVVQRNGVTGVESRNARGEPVRIELREHEAA